MPESCPPDRLKKNGSLWVSCFSLVFHSVSSQRRRRRAREETLRARRGGHGERAPYEAGKKPCRCIQSIPKPFQKPYNTTPKHMVFFYIVFLRSLILLTTHPTLIQNPSPPPPPKLFQRPSIFVFPKSKVATECVFS